MVALQLLHLPRQSQAWHQARRQLAPQLLGTLRQLLLSRLVLLVLERQHIRQHQLLEALPHQIQVVLHR
jgi:hypothetical protein